MLMTIYITFYPNSAFMLQNFVHNFFVWSWFLRHKYNDCFCVRKLNMNHFLNILYKNHNYLTFHGFLKFLYPPPSWNICVSAGVHQARGPRVRTRQGGNNHQQLDATMRRGSHSGRSLTVAPQVDLEKIFGALSHSQP